MSSQWEDPTVGNVPKIICLTPIRNEAWILETFLCCASVWADHIVVADQMSNDGSREIAARFPKVILVDNNCPTFNEPERVQLLLREARKILGPKILIALDADEILVGNLSWLHSEELLRVPTGTRLAFDWLNVHPSCQRYWNPNPPMTWGFVDDGSPHSGGKIHSGRVPEPNSSPLKIVQAVKIFHLQYIDWERMSSKHRWYQCFERLTYPTKSPVTIYRMYHHMDAIPESQMCSISADDLSPYSVAGIDPFRHRKESHYRWDNEVDDMILAHGSKVFRSLDIWGGGRINRMEAVSGIGTKKVDPRGLPQKLLIWYLGFTQRESKGKIVKLSDLFIKLLLKIFLPEVRPKQGQRS